MDPNQKNQNRRPWLVQQTTQPVSSLILRLFHSLIPQLPQQRFPRLQILKTDGN